MFNYTNKPDYNASRKKKENQTGKQTLKKNKGLEE